MTLSSIIVGSGNPSNGIFSIKTLDSSLQNQSAKIILRDVSGKLILEKNINTSLNTIDAGWLPSSTYYLKIYINQVVFSKTIIVQ